MASQLRDSPVPDPRRWQALGLLSVTQFLVILDTSIIGVALPAIKDALGFSTEGLQWVFNAYVIAFGGLLLVGGRLADLLGPRRVFAAGFAVLAGSSLLAGAGGRLTRQVWCPAPAGHHSPATPVLPAAHPVAWPGVSWVMGVHEGVTLAAADQPAVQRHRRDERNDQGESQGSPEQGGA